MAFDQRLACDLEQWLVTAHPNAAAAREQYCRYVHPKHSA